MFFHSDTSSSQGAAVSHHKLQRFESSSDLTMLRIWLSSWPNEESRLAGYEAIAQFHLVTPFNGLNLSNGLLAGISAFICAAEVFPACTEITDTNATLVGVKIRKWAEIKTERSIREAGTFSSAERSFGIDSRLSNEALNALIARQANQSYEVLWVLADNTSASLTAEEIIAAACAMANYLTSLSTISQQLRTAIEEASTVDQVASIAWP